jgi:hypothetical protein
VPADEGPVTIFARLSSSSVPGSSASLRGRTLVALFTAGFVSALLVIAAPAAAVVSTVEGLKVGLQSRDLASTNDGATVGSFRDEGDGPVLPANRTYAIYWDPTDSYHGNWQESINKFFHALGSGSGYLNSVFAVDTQYSDPANQHALYQSTFKGAYTDTNHYPTSGNCTDPSPLHAGRAITCLTSKQVQEQLEVFIAQHGLPKGMEHIYYLLTPPGVTVCLEAGHCSDYPGTPQEIELDEESHVEPTAYKIYKNSFCSYHSVINPDNAPDGDASTVLYGVIPWVAGGLGDFHLAAEDQTAAYDCQDGAFNFNPKTSREEKEHPKVDTKEEEEKRLAAEQKENSELTTYEGQFEKGLITEPELEVKVIELEHRKAARENEEKAEKVAREESEGPHQQEPNQDGRGEDGSYDGGLSDLIISQIGVEQQNIVTDPLLNGWQDSAGNESTDECRNFFAPTINGSVTGVEFTKSGTLFNQTYGELAAPSEQVNSYVDDAFNLAADKIPYPGVPCLTGVTLAPSFTGPNPVNAGETIGFDGMGSDITLDAGVKFSAGGKEEPTYPVFTWNFGDGSPEVSGYAPGAPSLNSPEAAPCETPWLAPCAASSFHAYKYGGTYEVTLTVTDVGGNTRSTTREVAVVGPAPPGSGGSGGSSGSSGSSTTSSSTSASTPAGAASPTSSPAAIPAPVAAATIVPQKLKSALHKGLVVSYSVNEQVAGSIEVLLSRAVAHRLGISGPPALGLPAGSPAEIVIGKAVLVTTQGGHSSVHVQFSKKTASRLAHAHSVSLMLRVVVRNAATSKPISTTVLSSATLSS